MATNLDAKKLHLIEKLMSVQEEAVIDKVVQLLQQEEMEQRAYQALQDIDNGAVILLNDFQKQSRQWMQDQKNTR